MSKIPQRSETIKKPVLCIGLTNGVAKSGRVWEAFQLKASIGRASVELPTEADFTNSIVKGASTLIGQTIEITLTNDTDVVGIGTYTIDGYMGIIASDRAKGFDIGVEDLKTLARTKKVSVNINPYV